MRFERLEGRTLLAGVNLPEILPDANHAREESPLWETFESLGAAYDHNTSGGQPESEWSLLPPAQLQYSTGAKSQLFIRAEFQDRGFDGSYDLGDAELRSRMAQISTFHIAESYGQVSYPDSLFDIAPGTVTLPYTVADMAIVGNFENTVHQAARQAVQDQIDAGTLILPRAIDDYDTVSVLFPDVKDIGRANWGGLASKPGQSLWLHDTLSTRIWAHELAHNMGAGHNDFWEPDDPAAIVSTPANGTQYEYGNHLDLMGDGKVGDDLSAYWKGRLGWLSEGVQIVDAVVDGTYPLYALDEGNAAADRTYGLRIERNAGQEYWLEHRATADDSAVGNTLIFNLRNYTGDQEPALLDMTPSSKPGDYQEDRLDAGLPLQSTYSDWDADLHVTPLSRDAAAGSDSIEVVVQHGPFPGNRPPSASLTADPDQAPPGEAITLTAGAFEPDGDPLAISWDFGDGQTAYGVTSAQHAWAESGQYPVRLSVSDTKGSAAERIQLVEVGATRQRIAQQEDLDALANSISAGDQSEPAIASDGAGRIIVVWQSDGQGIYAQRFSADGQKVGTEFLVNEAATGDQEKPDVAMDGAGNFIVVWQGQGNDQQEIFARQFDWNAVAQGPEFQVNTNEFFYQVDPAVATNPATGDFVVAWSSWVTGRDVRFRRYAADGAAIDGSERVAGGGRNSSQVDVAMNASGDFVLAWDDGLDSSSSEVYAQKFGSDGAEVVSPFQVNLDSTELQQDPSVALDADGKFTVVWETEKSGVALKTGWLRSFAADGTPSSEDISLSEQPSLGLANPVIAVDGQGRRIVAWRGGRENFSSSDDGDLGIRIFDADGTALSGDTRLTGQYTQWFSGPSLAPVNSSDGFVLVYPARSDSQVDVALKFFALPTAPALEPDHAETQVALATSIDVLANDSGLSGSFSVSVHAQPRHGSAVIDDRGTPADGSDDLIAYVPSGQFSGVDSFVYAISYGAGADFVQVVSVQVGSWANQPPTATADLLPASQGQATVIGLSQLLDNDFDTDGGQVQWQGFGQPQHGSVTQNADGSLLYVPDSTYTGLDSFTYDIIDGQGGTATGSVQLDVSSTSSGLAPADLLVYYGWPSILNGAGSVSEAVGEFAVYDYVVLGAGLEVTSHADHQNTAAILADQGVSATRFFGYIDLGVTTSNFSRDEIRQRVDQWRDLGADGIFFDDFGYDFDTSRERQNEAIAYAHSWGLPVIANGYLVDDVLGSSIDAVFNPSGSPTNLGRADFYLYEGFQVSRSEYVSEATWQNKAASLESYRADLGIQTLALTTAAAGVSFEQAQLEYAWHSALLYGYEGFGWGEVQFAAADGISPYRARPQTVLGSRFEGPVVNASPEYFRDMDQGRVTVDSASHSVVNRLDGDGVDAAVEDGAPNNGDGNNDGVPDRRQDHVSSLPGAGGAGYVTLATDADLALEAVAATSNPSPLDTPAGLDFPVGWFDFAIAGVEAGGAASLTFFWEAGPTLNTFYKYGPTPDNPQPHWYPFMFDGSTGAVIFQDRIVLHFQDGLRGDDDLTVNGRIVDAGGPGAVANPWMNPILPEDVDGNGNVEPLDALTLINEINANQSRQLPTVPIGSGRIPAFLDVDGSHGIEPNDVLQVINYINGR